MAVPAGFDTIESGYDIRSLNRLLNLNLLSTTSNITVGLLCQKKFRDLDFMNILSYDYHSAFEPQVNHHAPLRSLTDSRTFDPNEDLNVVSCRSNELIFTVW